MFRNKFFKILFKVGVIFITITSLLTIYSVFIERFDIQIQYTKLDLSFNKRFVLISDIHLGKFKDETYLTSVVEKINSIENVDAVLIAGDFIYQQDTSKLDKYLNPLSKIKFPVFAVLGNHDVLGSGAGLTNELIDILQKDNVTILNNEFYNFENIKIVGLGERYINNDHSEILNNLNKLDNVLVLAHNPDAVRDYPSLNNVDLTVSGHTHCGQVRIPLFYKSFLPVENKDNIQFDKGYYPDQKLFITCGLGEFGIPARLFNPPTIDVLDL